MRAQNWTDIMTLLTVMVVANKMDEHAELIMFKQAAQAVRDLAAPNVKLTDSFARDWIYENRAEIAMQASTVHYDTTVKRLLKNLSCLPNKAAILTVLMKWTLSEIQPAAPKKLRYTSPIFEDETNYALAG